MRDAVLMEMFQAAKNTTSVGLNLDLVVEKTSASDGFMERPTGDVLDAEVEDEVVAFVGNVGA